MPTYETEKDRKSELFICRKYCEHRGYDDYVRQKSYSPIDFGLLKDGQIVEFLECKRIKFKRIQMKGGMHFIGLEKLKAAKVLQSLGFRVGFAVGWNDMLGYREFTEPDKTGTFTRNDHRKDPPELGFFYNIFDFEIFLTGGK